VLRGELDTSSGFCCFILWIARTGHRASGGDTQNSVLAFCCDLLKMPCGLPIGRAHRIARAGETRRAAIQHEIEAAFQNVEIFILVGMNMRAAQRCRAGTSHARKRNARCGSSAHRSGPRIFQLMP